MAGQLFGILPMPQGKNGRFSSEMTLSLAVEIALFAILFTFPCQGHFGRNCARVARLTVAIGERSDIVHFGGNCARVARLTVAFGERGDIVQ